MPPLARKPPAAAPARLRGAVGGTIATTHEMWVQQCLLAATTPATLYASARKIIRPYRMHFTSLDDTIRLADAGFTKNKITALTRHYLHKDSQRAALDLWQARRRMENYGSVGFTTYNHLVKGDVEHKSPRGSAFGPCLQSIIITHVHKKHYAVDVMYRSTELFKKFLPDLVFIRDVLLSPFDFERMSCDGVTFHFANVTVHPMYWVTLVPHIDPIAHLEVIRRGDSAFHSKIVKWTAHYVCPEYIEGITKFAQAMRVREDALTRVDKTRLKQLQAYVRHHRGGVGVVDGVEDDEETDEAD